MPRLTFARIVAAALLSLTVSTVAEAKPAAPAFMPTGEAADAPAGFLDMCRRDAQLCAAGLPLPADAYRQVLAAARPVVATPTGFGTAAYVRQARVSADTSAVTRRPGEKDKSLIQRVDRQTNRAVVQVSDLALTGQDEYWERPDPRHPAGDCEDIAIEKRERLLAAGFPPSRMFFAVAFHNSFGLHTVLIVRMDDGDYVLDSLTSRVVRWSQSHYSWLRVQSATNPLLWNRFGEAPTPVRFAVAPPAPAPVVALS